MFFTQIEENLCAKHLEAALKRGTKARVSLASLKLTIRWNYDAHSNTHFCLCM